ncbi:response regulator [Geomonas sp. Red32]|uniref:response regulator n=1 Tax=Geomonas sp. Red32 TaxID=2912856 RepID=UPI00202CADFE|nr:response regulator [Geomonas sp. Red32]MCM0083562.1 response regulator [Geomonas sp. Red32]
MDRRSILVVDDDAVYLNLMKSIIEQMEYTADTAVSANDALRLLEASRYRLMITDMSMPGTNGLELTVKAKKIAPDLNVVMLTGDVSPELLVRATEAGISELWQKPCQANRIRRLLRDLQ